VTGDERNKLVIQGWSGERHTESLIQSSIPESAFSASNKESHTQDQIQALLKAGQELKRQILIGAEIPDVLKKSFDSEVEDASPHFAQTLSMPKESHRRTLSIELGDHQPLACAPDIGVTSTETVNDTEDILNTIKEMQESANIKTYIADEFSGGDHSARPRLGFVATNLISLNEQIFQEKAKLSPRNRFKRTVYSRNPTCYNGAQGGHSSFLAQQ